MIASGGARLQWAQLPAAVRAWVDELLGSPVTQAESQAGGFSPGSADRVRTAAGGRAFVKAVSADLNPDSVRMHRSEARVAAALPPELPAPPLLGSYDADGWVALAFADVDGRTPQLPWQRAELDTVLEALAVLAGAPCPVPDLAPARKGITDMFAGVHRIDAAAVAGLDLPALVEPAIAALDGDALVHVDLRADNVLLTADGAVLVDWPHACRGPAWLDTLLLLMEVDRFGGHDVDALLAAHPATRAVDPAVLDGALAGCLGFFLDQARRPAPPGLPRLREFQQVQADALLEWLRRRLS
ncbi:hypothetical protein ACQEVB_06575 [Pseudonocardia sp. CA-107938]|uniref:hypothetical protein n=1 Tax=Pseudonocardia sp. CA-107938 TaxID=3240021 RepID=UPI003D903D30